jgi:hypothetical protein
MPHRKRFASNRNERWRWFELVGIDLLIGRHILVGSEPRWRGCSQRSRSEDRLFRRHARLARGGATDASRGAGDRRVAIGCCSAAIQPGPDERQVRVAGRDERAVSLQVHFRSLAGCGGLTHAEGDAAEARNAGESAHSHDPRWRSSLRRRRQPLREQGVPGGRSGSHPSHSRRIVRTRRTASSISSRWDRPLIPALRRSAPEPKDWKSGAGARRRRRFPRCRGDGRPLPAGRRRARRAPRWAG